MTINNLSYLPFNGLKDIDQIIFSYMEKGDIEQFAREDSPYCGYTAFARDEVCRAEGFPEGLIKTFRNHHLSLWHIPIVPIKTVLTEGRLDLPKITLEEMRGYPIVCFKSPEKETPVPAFKKTPVLAFHMEAYKTNTAIKERLYTVRIFFIKKDHYCWDIMGQNLLSKKWLSICEDISSTQIHPRVDQILSGIYPKGTFVDDLDKAGYNYELIGEIPQVDRQLPKSEESPTTLHWIASTISWGIKYFTSK